MSPVVKQLETWLSANGIWLNAECIEIVVDSDRPSGSSTAGLREPGQAGINTDTDTTNADTTTDTDTTTARRRPRPSMWIRSRRGIPADEVVCRIPKSAILSPLVTSPLAPVLHHEKLGGSLALTLALLHELRLGERSRWFHYLRTLPHCEHGLPIVWLYEQQQRQLRLREQQQQHEHEHEHEQHEHEQQQRKRRRRMPSVPMVEQQEQPYEPLTQFPVDEALALLQGTEAGRDLEKDLVGSSNGGGDGDDDNIDISIRRP